jgi:hypothetical protein
MFLTMHISYIHTHTCMYAHAPGQDTMGNGQWPCAWALLQLAILCFVCRVSCVVLLYDMYFRCTCTLTPARNSRRGRGGFVLHKISRSTARGDVAGCILRSYLPLLSKRRMPRSEPALFSPQYTQGRATRAHSHSHFHFHPRNCCGLWPWWRVE